MNCDVELRRGILEQNYSGRVGHQKRECVAGGLVHGSTVRLEEQACHLSKTARQVPRHLSLRINEANNHV